MDRPLLTCDDVEALLAAGEADVVGDEGRVGVRLHAGVARLPQLQPPRLLRRQEAGPDVGHGRRDRRRRKAHHRVQLGRGVAQRLQGVHVAWTHTDTQGNTRTHNKNHTGKIP